MHTDLKTIHMSWGRTMYTDLKTIHMSGGGREDHAH